VSTVNIESHDPLLESDDYGNNWKRLTGALVLSLVFHISLAGTMYHMFTEVMSPPGKSSLSIDIVSTRYSERTEPQQQTAEAPIMQPAVPQPVKHEPLPEKKPVQKKLLKKVKTVKIVAAKQAPVAITTDETVTPLAEVKEMKLSDTVMASLPEIPSIRQSSISSAAIKPSRQELSIHPVYAPQPVYPRPARRLGLEGRVLLSVWVTADGIPDVIVVKESSGHESLDESAKTGVQKWRFVVPADESSTADRWLDLPVTFRLE